MHNADNSHNVYNCLLGDFGKTMKELSIDDSKADDPKYLVASDLKAVGLDNLVRTKFTEKLKCKGDPSTCDAWYIDASNWYLIEFKSGTFNFNEFNVTCPECEHSFCLNSKSKSKHEIFLKCTESLLIISEIVNTTIEFTRENLKFVLVVEDTSSLVDTHSHLVKKADGSYIPEKLRRLHKMYFKDV